MLTWFSFAIFFGSFFGWLAFGHCHGRLEQEIDCFVLFGIRGERFADAYTQAVEIVAVAVAGRVVCTTRF
jgi:hypothetical protein